MTVDPVPPAGGDFSMERSGSPPAPSRRWPIHYIAAGAVMLAMGAMLAATARHALFAPRSVIVRPVLMAPEPPAPQTPASPTTTSPPRPTRMVQAPGWLEAEPFYIACAALADGVIEQILVLEGDRVEQGQPVATLVSDDARLALARAEADLAGANAELATVLATVAAARADWDNPVERERAVTSTLASLAEARAELAQLPDLIREQVADLERLQEELKRSREALSSQAATDIEVIILEKRAAAQSAAIEALRSSEQILTARIDRLVGEAKAAERNAQLRIAERRALDEATADELRAQAGVALATAVRDEARLRLDRMRIHAPITGYVQRRLKVPGDKVMLAMDDPHSSHIVHMYDPSKLQVRVDVPLADAPAIFVDQRCEVVVDVLPDQTFAGRVLRITHEADIQKNTLQVKVQVIDPSPLLRPEMLTRVRFLPDGAPPTGAANPATSQHSNPMSHALVHADCIEAASDGAAPRVWVVRGRKGDSGVVQPLSIRLRESGSPWSLVESTLLPGDLVVSLAEGLTAGLPVRMVELGSTEGAPS